MKGGASEGNPSSHTKERRLYATVERVQNPWVVAAAAQP